MRTINLKHNYRPPFESNTRFKKRMQSAANIETTMNRKEPCASENKEGLRSRRLLAVGQRTAPNATRFFDPL
jgi:hypothetical protein